jgi:hypothetical protein
MFLNCDDCCLPTSLTTVFISISCDCVHLNGTYSLTRIAGTGTCCTAGNLCPNSGLGDPPCPPCNMGGVGTTAFDGDKLNDNGFCGGVGDGTDQGGVDPCSAFMCLVCAVSLCPGNAGEDGVKFDFSTIDPDCPNCPGTGSNVVDLISCNPFLATYTGKILIVPPTTDDCGCPPSGAHCVNGSITIME